MTKALQHGTAEYRMVIGAFAKFYPEQSLCCVKHKNCSWSSVQW